MLCSFKQRSLLNLNTFCIVPMLKKLLSNRNVPQSLFQNFPRRLSNVTFSVKTSLSPSCRRSFFSASRDWGPLPSSDYHTPHQITAQGTHGYSHFLKSRKHISSLFVFELTIVPNTVLYIQLCVTLSYIEILVYWIWLETSSPLVDILKSCSYTEYLLRWFFCIITGSKRELIIITISWASTLCQGLTYYVM